MDPNATLAALLDAVKENNPEEIAEHTAVLVHWLNKGGFPPKIIDPKHDKFIATAICQLATQAAQYLRMESGYVNEKRATAKRSTNHSGW
jgi:5,10-methenyltetrahydromethanopterin hydrogenase